MSATPPTETKEHAEIARTISALFIPNNSKAGDTVKIGGGLAGGGIVENGRDLNFQGRNQFAKNHGFESPNELYHWVSENFGETFEGKVVPFEDPSKKEEAAERLSIAQYAVALAQVAAMRSEDPYRKVGAVAFDKDNRVIGTAYNGLSPGFTPPENFWDDREGRQKFMLHAEVNLCSLFRRGEAKIIATTTMPCTSCMQMICAYGISKVYYIEPYPGSDAGELARIYGVHLEQIKPRVRIR